MEPSDILTIVRELAAPIAEEGGLELVDIEFVRDNRGWVLRVLLDKETGVTLDDCTYVSRELGAVLEIKDVISHPYNLEVSSPGLERPLKTVADFERFRGRTVSVRTSTPLDRQKNFKGILVGVDGGEITLDLEGKTCRIPLATIQKAKLVYEFSEKK